VSYVNDDNTVVRYSLVRGTNDFFYFTLEPYDGQLIKKDFRIEIWNTSSGSVSEQYQTLIYTSVLGNIDYRYGMDSPLVSTNTLCEGQQTTGTIPAQPAFFEIAAWLDGGTGWSIFNWIDLVDSIPFNSASGLSTFTAPNIIHTNGAIFQGNVDTVKSVWMYVVANDTTFLSLDNNVGGTASIGIDSNFFLKMTVGANTYTGTYQLSVGSAYIIYFDSSSVCNIYDAVTLELLDSVAGIVSDFSAAGISIQIGTVAKSFSIRSILMYHIPSLDPTIFTQYIFPYMLSLTSGGVSMTLPWTWDVCGTNPPAPPIPPVGGGATIGIG